MGSFRACSPMMVFEPDLFASSVISAACWRFAPSGHSTNAFLPFSRLAFMTLANESVSYPPHVSELRKEAYLVVPVHSYTADYQIHVWVIRESFRIAVSLCAIWKSIF